MAEGEPFFFKTHAPDNCVVGGGFFGGFAPLRVSEAWDLLGAANGVASQEAMMRRIARYRREPIAPGAVPGTDAGVTATCRCRLRHPRVGVGCGTHVLVRT